MLPQLMLVAEEQAPEANDVVAGWTGLFLLLALVAAVALLGWSLTKQLKKVEKAASEGVYDDPEAADTTEESDSGGPAR